MKFAADRRGYVAFLEVSAIGRSRAATPSKAVARKRARAASGVGNPISDGQDRTTLDAMLRDVASTGALGQRPSGRDPQDGREGGPSSHQAPWMGHRHASLSLRPGVPRRISAEASIGGPARPQAAVAMAAGRLEGRARLGNLGRELVRVLQAVRGSVGEDMSLGDFMTRCEPYFAAEGSIVDQPFQPRLPDGMIRCYMSADKVVGFGHQLVKALIPPPPEGPASEAAQPGPRIMHPASAPAFRPCGRRWNRNGRLR